MKILFALIIALMTIKLHAQSCKLTLETQISVCKNYSQKFNKRAFENDLKLILENKGYTVLNFDSSSVGENNLVIYLNDDIHEVDCYSARRSALINAAEIKATVQFTPRSSNRRIVHETLTASALFGRSNRLWNKLTNRIYNFITFEFPDCQ